MVPWEVSWGDPPRAAAISCGWRLPAHTHPPSTTHPYFLICGFGWARGISAGGANTPQHDPGGGGLDGVGWQEGLQAPPPPTTKRMPPPSVEPPLGNMLGPVYLTDLRCAWFILPGIQHQRLSAACPPFELRTVLHESRNEGCHSPNMMPRSRDRLTIASQQVHPPALRAMGCNYTNDGLRLVKDIRLHPYAGELSDGHHVERAYAMLWVVRQRAPSSVLRMIQLNWWKQGSSNSYACCRCRPWIAHCVQYRLPYVRWTARSFRAALCLERLQCRDRRPTTLLPTCSQQLPRVCMLCVLCCGATPL